MMTATSALNTATANPLAPTAAPQGNPAGVPAPSADEEILSVGELLQLLEQNTGFAQVLANTDTPAALPVPADGGAAVVDGAASRRHKDAAPAEEDDTPCDIATLIRLLESQAQPPAVAAVAAAGIATASAAAAACASASGAMDGAASAVAGSFSEAQVPSRPASGLGRAVAALPAAVSGASSGVVGDAGPLVAAHAATAVPPAADAAAAAGREGSMLRLPDATPPSADPAQVTLSFVQNFKSDVPTSAPVERVIHVPVRDPAWPQAVAAEIRFLTDQKVEAATLRLSPEHLGPVEVRIDVRDNNVSVSFGAVHVDTQAALEQALPRLREMFAAAGLNLGHASVQQEARRGSHNGGAAPAPGAGATGSADGAGGDIVRGVGLVDEYA
jgi:flagellar hook-length control protein FliK